MTQSSSGARAHWLNAERVLVYARLFAGLYLLIGLGWVALSAHGVDRGGKPLGYDFITFWGASYTWWQGDPAGAYDYATLLRAEQAAVPAITTFFAWFYPPTFYLLILPLALLPYLLAYLVFTAGTLLAYMAALRPLLPPARATLLMLAFPGVLINAAHGQNGFLTAALAALALAAMERRALLSGLLIGLLLVKPHLGVLFPLALLCAGRWKVAAAAAASALCFGALSVAVVGAASVPAFLHSLPLARQALESGTLPWTKMPTVFAALRLLGCGLAPAYLMHAAVALLAAGAVGYVWRTEKSEDLRGAALFAGTFLISPYLFDYDLVWMAFPIAWLSARALREGWLKGERETLLAAWLGPLLAPVIAKASGLQSGPLITLALLALIVRRSVAARRAAPPPST